MLWHKTSGHYDTKLMFSPCDREWQMSVHCDTNRLYALCQYRDSSIQHLYTHDISLQLPYNDLYKQITSTIFLQQYERKTTTTVTESNFSHGIHITYKQPNWKSHNSVTIRPKQKKTTVMAIHLNQQKISVDHRYS